MFWKLQNTLSVPNVLDSVYIFGSLFCDAGLRQELFQGASNAGCDTHFHRELYYLTLHKSRFLIVARFMTEVIYYE